MAVSRAEVEHVARLARLRLAPEEAERLTRELNGILEHVRALEEVDASGVEGVGGAAEWEAPLRPDEPGADPLAFPPSELAPAWRDGFFTVPRLAALDGDTAAAEGGGAEGGTGADAGGGAGP